MTLPLTAQSRYSQVPRGDSGSEDGESFGCILAIVILVNAFHIMLALIPALVALLGSVFNDQGESVDLFLLFLLLLVLGGFTCAGLGINGAVQRKPCQLYIAGVYYWVQSGVTMILFVAAMLILGVDFATSPEGLVCLVVVMLPAMFATLHFLLASKMTDAVRPHVMTSATEHEPIV
jgi:hypothetical protein